MGVRAKPDRRSPEAQAYRALYHTARWLRLRKQQLAKQPLCEMCAARGKVTAANTVDHKVEHKGDLELFFSGELASLCANCHSGAKQQIERIGYSDEIGADGWPVDPRNPAFQK